MARYNVRYLSSDYEFGKGHVTYYRESKEIPSPSLQTLRARLLKEYMSLSKRYKNLTITVSERSFEKGHLASNSRGIYWEDYPESARYHIYPSGRVKYDLTYYLGDY